MRPIVAIFLTAAAASGQQPATAHQYLLATMLYFTRWQGSPVEKLGLERAFNHGSMKAAPIQFRDVTWKDWFGAKPQQPLQLRRFASSFINLQEQRNSADYDNHRRWAPSEVWTLINSTQLAFLDWAFIQDHPQTGSYLLAMLLGKQR